MGGKHILIVTSFSWRLVGFLMDGAQLVQVPTVSYPRFVQLLDFRCYSKPLLSGLVVAIGGLQDSLRKASLAALLDYLQVAETVNCNESNSRELNLSTDILWVLQHYKRCDRVITPTLKVIHMNTVCYCFRIGSISESTNSLLYSNLYNSKWIN